MFGRFDTIGRRRRTQQHKFAHAHSLKHQQDLGKIRTFSKRHLTHRQLEGTSAFDGLSVDASRPLHHILRFVWESHFHKLLVDPWLYTFTWEQPLHLDGLFPKLGFFLQFARRSDCWSMSGSFFCSTSCYTENIFRASRRFIPHSIEIC